MYATNLSVRIDSELKKNVEACLNDMGLNISTAIIMYFKQIHKLKAIPFEVTANPMPNKVTLRAMREAEHLARDPSAKGYKDMDSLMKALDL